MKINRRSLIFTGYLLVGMTLLMAGCAEQPMPTTTNPPGFFMGIVHGFIMPFSFIGSWFTDIRIYAYPNAGTWYDFGYLIGATMILGGGGASSR